MPNIKPTSDLLNNSNEIRNLYAKLAEADTEIASGAEGVDFFEFAKRLRTDVHGKNKESISSVHSGLSKIEAWEDLKRYKGIVHSDIDEKAELV